MTTGKQRKPGDSTIIAGKGEPKPQFSATQILTAAEVRAAKKKRVGESSVILREGEQIRRTGLGVAVRFAIIIALLIAVFMAGFGIFIYNDFKGALNDEIDAAGVTAARALSQPDVFTWNLYHRAYANTALGGYEEKISSGDLKVKEGELQKSEQERAERRIAVNKQRLESLLSKDGRILDAVISNVDRTKIYRSATNSPRLQFTGDPQPDREGVSIQYGTYTTPAGQTLPARSFVAPIVGTDGNVEGQAMVVLAETSIQEKLQAVKTQVMVLALVFMLIGVGIAFLVGMGIARPIKALTRDVEVIAKGDFDHRTDSSGRDEIGVLAKTVDRMARSLAEAQRASLDHARQKHQLQVALEIQANLFPKNLPAFPGYDVEAHYQPGPEVGGDYYDIFPMKDGRWFLMVASASGKGIPAAMLTTMARSFITAVAERESSPKELLKVVNRLLSPDLRRGMYVTALACVLDPRTGKLLFVNAGHNPLIKFDGATHKVSPIHADGIALGFDKGPVFERTMREVEMDLKPGDRVVLCTPGVFGIKNHEGSELGEANFYKLVEREGAKPGGAFVKLMTHALGQFTDGGWVESDITFVSLSRQS